MRDPLVSIIIPAYNSEKFLSPCLDSVAHQTYKNLEIIVVDDGSTDRTAKVVEKYAKMDPRFRKIKGDHRGANVARGRGVSRASGDFLMFLDADDWISKNAVKTLVTAMSTGDYDSVKFNAIIEPSKRLKYPYIQENDTPVALDADDARHLLATGASLNNLCFQFYRAELFSDIESFDIEISNCEDYLVNLELSNKVRRVLFIGDVLYHYRSNPDSTTKNRTFSRIVKNIQEQVFVRAKLLDYIDAWGFNSAERKHLSFLAFNKVRSGIFNLLQAEGIDKQLFIETVSSLLNNPDYVKIIDGIKSRENLKGELKKMPYFFRIKYSKSLLGLYDKKLLDFWLSTLPYRFFLKSRRGGGIGKYMRGRLGNQLFQYATARYIQEVNGGKDSLFFNFSRHVYSIGFKNDLKNFKIKPYTEVDKIEMTFLQKMIVAKDKIIKRIYRVFRPSNYLAFRYSYEDRHQKSLQRRGIYWKENGRLKISTTRAHKKVLIGHFESSRNFDKIRPQLLEEIQPIEPPLEKNKQLYLVINTTESVCVSIRRGDFVENPEFSKKFNVCGIHYFQSAIAEIKKRVKNPVFIIFSDDIKWCRENIVLPNDEVYYEDGTDPVWEKLRLMYSCKHFIISNSTFSWWAQYLSRNSDKVVIAPAKWTNSGYNKDIYDSDWILVDNEVRHED